MSFLWASDLHTKPASVYSKTTLTGDAFYALDQLQDFAIGNRVEAVILGGDVTDCNQPGGDTFNRLAAFVRKCNEHDIIVYYIEGNHDRVNRNPFLPKEYYTEHRLLSSIGALPLTQVTLDGLRITGLDYCPADLLHERLGDLEECDVLCMHAGFRHLLGFEDAYYLEKDDIPETVKKMVLVGHVHVHDESVTKRGVRVLSSGSTWVWRVDEADKEHGFFHFVDGEPTFKKLDVRKYYDIDCVEDIVDTQAEEHVLPPVLRYPSEAMPDLDRGDHCGVILIPVDENGATEEGGEFEGMEAADLAEALVVGVPRDQFPKQHVFMKDLLDSSTPFDYVKETLERMGVTFKQGA